MSGISKCDKRVHMAKKNSKQAVLNGSSPLRDGNTLFAPNAEGEIVARPIVNMTTEVDVPGTSAKVKVTGTVEQVIAYINTNFPDYVWPDVEDLKTITSKVSAVDNTVYCDIGKQGSYHTATIVMTHLRHFGSHTINVGGGPAACVSASCHTEDSGTTVAFWFCNDVGDSLRAVINAHLMRLCDFQYLLLCFGGQDLLGASPSYNDIADLAQIVLDQCVEFGAPLSWIRGQAFDTLLPWNVIVTAQDSC
jgi:hypothetical protein